MLIGRNVGPVPFWQLPQRNQVVIKFFPLLLEQLHNSYIFSASEAALGEFRHSWKLHSV